MHASSLFFSGQKQGAYVRCSGCLNNGRGSEWSAWIIRVPCDDDILGSVLRLVVRNIFVVKVMSRHNMALGRFLRYG